jgi:hypothetical protein
MSYELQTFGVLNQT